MFGKAIFKVFNFTSVVQQYVSGDKDLKSATTDSAAKDDVKMFAAESESVVFLNLSLVISEKELFKEFHDFVFQWEQYFAPCLTIVESVKKHWQLTTNRIQL